MSCTRAWSFPDDDELRAALERGQMVLDILIELGVPVTFARTRVIPALLGPRERAGKLLGVRRTTAVMELEELIYSGRDERVAYSRDMFAPGRDRRDGDALARVHAARAGREPAQRPRGPSAPRAGRVAGASSNGAK